MSEAIEALAALKPLKPLKQAKRASNREQSAALLSRAGVVFDSKNKGAHLVVYAGAAVVDFWPGTGMWIARDNPVRRRGVRKLLAFVEHQRSAAADESARITQEQHTAQLAVRTVRDVSNQGNEQ